MVAMTGLHSGSMMLPNILNSEQPSMRAASSSPVGNDTKNWRIMKMPKALVARGRISPR